MARAPQNRVADRWRPAGPVEYRCEGRERSANEPARTAESWARAMALGQLGSGRRGCGRPYHGNLSGRLDQKDPHVPGAVADDQRPDRDARGIKNTPVGSGDTGSAHEGEVASRHVDG